MLDISTLNRLYKPTYNSGVTYIIPKIYVLLTRFDAHQVVGITVHNKPQESLVAGAFRTISMDEL